MENEQKKRLLASLQESFFGYYKEKNVKMVVKICLMGLLTALLIVFERTIYIPVGESSRYSFTFVMVYISGLLLGGIDAMIVTGAADVLGGILAGYSINPLITACVMISGMSAGTLLFKERSLIKLSVAIVINQLVCSLLLKSAAFAIFYGGGMHSYPHYFTIRIVQFAIMTPVEFVVMFLLYKSLFGRLKKMVNEVIIKQ